MSGYKFHIAIGFCISLILLIILNQTNYFKLVTVEFLIPWFIITLIFSIIPDIDARKSKASLFLHILIVLCIILFFIPLIPIYTTISIIFILLILETYHLIFAKKGRGHRHWSHNVFFGLILSIFISIVSSEWLLGIFAFVSFLSHLAIDKFVPY